MDYTYTKFYCGIIFCRIIARFSDVWGRSRSLSFPSLSRKEREGSERDRKRPWTSENQAIRINVTWQWRHTGFSSNAPINVNPVRGECGQGAGIWCLRLSPCRAFDRAKRPWGRDIWLWPTEAWYQFRSGYQVCPSRLFESHAVVRKVWSFHLF